MGWNGSGTFNRTDGTRSGTQVWQDAKDAGVKIRSDDHDTHDQDIADGLENTVAKDGQNTTTTDNAILRFDSGNNAFEGVSISASQLVGRSASGDTRALTAATARQTIGVGTAAPTNNQFLYWASASSQYVQATAATARSLIGLGTAAPTNNQALFYASASSEYQQKSAATARSLLGLGTAAPSNNGILVYSSAASQYQNGTLNSSNIEANSVTNSEIASNTIDQGNIANDAVGQGELKTATANTTSGNIGNNNVGTVSLVGGSWSHWALSQGDSKLTMIANRGATHFDIEVLNETGGTDTFEVNERYHSASRPYDLGDGEVGLFVTLVIQPNGIVNAHSISSDPIWAYNGPTDITPDWIDKKTGKKYKYVRHPTVTLNDVESGRAEIDDYISAQKEAVWQEVEITPEYKNSDMHLIPHSWPHPPEGTICLLDPVNTHDLLMLHEAGEDVGYLIHRGYIKIGDECKRRCPPCVMPVSWKWKNSR